LSNLGLCILIDHFAPNIRYEVRRAFIVKDPFQPTDYKFPTSNYKRSFRKTGLGNTIGWNIVWRIIKLIAFIAIILYTIEMKVEELL
jgi:hypothetical protein